MARSSSDRSPSPDSLCCGNANEATAATCVRVCSQRMTGWVRLRRDSHPRRIVAWAPRASVAVVCHCKTRTRAHSATASDDPAGGESVPSQSLTDVVGKVRTYCGCARNGHDTLPVLPWASTECLGNNEDERRYPVLYRRGVCLLEHVQPIRTRNSGLEAPCIDFHLVAHRAGAALRNARRAKHAAIGPARCAWHPPSCAPVPTRFRFPLPLPRSAPPLPPK